MGDTNADTNVVGNFELVDVHRPGADSRSQAIVWAVQHGFYFEASQGRLEDQTVHE